MGAGQDRLVSSAGSWPNVASSATVLHQSPILDDGICIPGLIDNYPGFGVGILAFIVMIGMSRLCVPTTLLS